MALFSSLLSHPKMAARYRFIRKCLSPPLTRDKTEIQFIIREYHPSRIRSRRAKVEARHGVCALLRWKKLLADGI